MNGGCAQGHTRARTHTRHTSLWSRGWAWTHHGGPKKKTNDERETSNKVLSAVNTGNRVQRPKQSFSFFFSSTKPIFTHVDFLCQSWISDIYICMYLYIFVCIYIYIYIYITETLWEQWGQSITSKGEKPRWFVYFGELNESAASKHGV